MCIALHCIAAPEGEKERLQKCFITAGKFSVQAQAQVGIKIKVMDDVIKHSSSYDRAINTARTHFMSIAHNDLCS